MSADQTPTHRIVVEDTQVVRTVYEIAVPEGEDPREEFALLQSFGDVDLPAISRLTLRRNWDVLEVEQITGTP